MKEFEIDTLKVAVFPDRKSMGKKAAEHVASIIAEVLKTKEEIRIVFAAAASQREFISALLNIDSIEWNKIVALHMDEYNTLPATAPQRFGNFLKEHLFKHKDFKQVHYFGESLDEYAKIVDEAPIDLVCLGIGENGHLAFNDPPVADFYDNKTVKEVELDLVCRQQQVNDGEFSHVDDVPKTAATLTIPALMKATYLSVVVPGQQKAEAIQKTLLSPISTECPASILRVHNNAKLFIDSEAAKFVMENENV